MLINFYPIISFYETLLTLSILYYKHLIFILFLYKLLERCIVFIFSKKNIL